MDTIYLYLTILLPVISSVVTWFVSRRKRHNDGINDQQTTIDRLLKRQSEITSEVMRLQRDNINLQRELARLMSILTPEQLLQYQQTLRYEQLQNTDHRTIQ